MIGIKWRIEDYAGIVEDWTLAQLKSESQLVNYTDDLCAKPSNRTPTDHSVVPEPPIIQSR